MQLTLVTGGARSGKSSFAQKIAVEKARSHQKTGIVYLATALVGDLEMQRRVKLHQQSRPQEWITVEEPYELASAVQKIPGRHLLLIDCLTVWITNLLFLYLAQDKEPGEKPETGWNITTSAKEQAFFLAKETALEKYMLAKVDYFLKTLSQTPLTCILVTNEVGWGIVPEHYLGRLFRDLAGKVNQQVAAHATEVYLLTAGIPFKIKG